jgi:hypothetical protein
MISGELAMGNFESEHGEIPLDHPIEREGTSETDRRPAEGFHPKLGATAEHGPSCIAGPETIETDFVDIGDGKVVELLEDPANPNRTVLGIWDGRKLQYVDNFEREGHIFKPLQRDGVLRWVRLPRVASPFGSLQALMRGIENLISQCVNIQPWYLPVLADFVLCTWLVDRFQVAPYLYIIGLPQSGKTTLLKILSLLCRRSLLTADITAASFYRACVYIATILIDEAATLRNNRHLRHILRTGTTKDVMSLQANHSFHAYGAKVISWLEPPDDPALNSRCILIPMSEAIRTDLCATSDPAIKQAAATLEAQLLQYRLENYAKVKLSRIEGDQELRPRSRDLLRTLSAASLQDADRSQSLLKFFISGNAVPLEPLSLEQNAVLLALFVLIHAGENVCSLRTCDLTRNVNHCLRLSGDKRCLQPRKVGAVLTSLGFSNRTRGNSGWCVFFLQGDMKKIHQLAENYGIDRASERVFEALVGRKFSPEQCTLCQTALKNETHSVPTIDEHALVKIAVQKPTS